VIIRTKPFVACYNDERRETKRNEEKHGERTKERSKKTSSRNRWVFSL